MAFVLTDLKNLYIALRGFHTDRRLIAIESDDWGSIRMPSHDTFVRLQELGDHPEKDGFLSNDCLESEYDLTELYRVLQSVTDKDGHPAVITANFVMANPDFDTIDIGSGHYQYESFFSTYKRYYPEDDVLGCVKKGIAQGVFFPQLHCREHLNVNRWMKDLKNGKRDTRIAFENRMIGINASFSDDNIFGYMDAFNTVESTNKELMEIVTEASRMFSEVFGFNSSTFVASCFVWNKSLEGQLAKLGIKGIQSSPWQYNAIGQNGDYRLKRKIHFTGEKNKYGQFYTVRNCSYEPAYIQNVDECISRCLKEIDKSFKYKKPAIITSHRFNYISRISPLNARNNLYGLQRLLESIVKKYPDAEFVTSPKLIQIMENK